MSTNSGVRYSQKRRPSLNKVLIPSSPHRRPALGVLPGLYYAYAKPNRSPLQIQGTDIRLGRSPCLYAPPIVVSPENQYHRRTVS